MAVSADSATGQQLHLASVPSSSQPWQERAADKRRRILAQVPPEYHHPELTHSLEDTDSVMGIPTKLLSENELAITALDAVLLVTALKGRKYTSVEVLNAFTHRAAIAHRLLNCCLDFPYAAALARAQQLDQHLAVTGSTVGPLHGLPVSVKDQCRLKGTETTCGFIYPLGHPDDDDAVLVSILQAAGAVIFTKTSLSIGCMWGETVNNILGRASNPYNRSFSCGGSSGGEGALIGFHGSAVGFGSDLGGSIRSPSAYQGLYGLRPSDGRIPYYRMLNSMEGQATIKSVVGPMATSIETIELMAKVIADSRPWDKDPQCHPIPWREEVASQMACKKLRIGLFEYDDVILPQPPVRNSLKRTAAALRAAGHEIIPWKIDQARAVDLILRCFRADAAGDIRRQCGKSGETPMESACDTPNPPLELLQSWDLAMECLSFRAEVLRLWNETADEAGRVMDAYIAPVNPAVAPRHGDYSLVRYFSYTATVNLLDYSACTFPTGFVDPARDLPDDETLMKDAAGETLPAPTCERDETIRRKYSSPGGPEGYRGLLVTLQVVCRKLEEEKVIAIVKTIRDALENTDN